MTTVGAEVAAALRRLTLEVYGRAEGLTRERGIILADTKLEFGRREDGTLVLGGRGAHARLLPVLAGGQLAARAAAAVLRQAVRARLADITGLGVG